MNIALTPHDLPPIFSKLINIYLLKLCAKINIIYSDNITIPCNYK